MKKLKKAKKRIEIFKVRRRMPIQVPRINANIYENVSPQKVNQLVARARDISRQLDEVKPLYGELDEITFALLNVKQGLAKHGVTIVDRFAQKNTAFKTVGIRRYELEWVRS